MMAAAGISLNKPLALRATGRVLSEVEGMRPPLRELCMPKSVVVRQKACYASCLGERRASRLSPDSSYAHRVVSFTMAQVRQERSDSA
jgi:hypothetical protein